MKLTTHLAALAAGIAVGYQLFHPDAQTASSVSELAQAREALPEKPEKPAIPSDSRPLKERKPAVIVADKVAENAPQGKDTDALEARIEELERQLARAATINAAATGNAPSHTTRNELRDRLAAEARNENWAYQVETQVADFLYVSGFSEHIALKEAICKETMCRFNFARTQESAHEGNPDFDPWRSFNDQLRQQPWYKQFASTNAQSNSDSIEIYTSRPAVR